MKNYIVLFTLILITLIFLSPVELKFRIIGIGITLFISGLLLSKEYDGEYGLVLIKGSFHKKIEELKIPKQFLELFVDLGFFLGFGIFSLLFRKIKLKHLLFSLFISFLFYVFVIPVTYTSILHQKIEVNYVKSLFLSLAGFSTLTLVSLFGTSYSILFSIFTGQTAQPGATLLIPGVNLPLIEGVLSILFIAVFHEASHALLAIYHKIKIKSSGVVLFGIIPIGAFVEPDEKSLSSKSKIVQQDVLIAGSSANFLLSFLASLLLFGFLYVFSAYSVNGYVLTGQYQGIVLYSLNNQSPANFSALANQSVFAETSKGTIVFKADENGKLGIAGYLASKDVPYFENPILQFIYSFLSLFVTLNFIIASVNLLPVFLLDGQKIFSISLPSYLSKPIIYLTTASLLLSFLPWLL